MAETLIAAGVDINTPSANGTHILPFSIINGRDQFALFLIERGADPNGSLGGIRALHAAVGAVGPWMGGFGGLGIPVNRRLPVHTRGPCGGVARPRCGPERAHHNIGHDHVLCGVPEEGRVIDASPSSTPTRNSLPMSRNSEPSATRTWSISFSLVQSRLSKKDTMSASRIQFTSPR